MTKDTARTFSVNERDRTTKVPHAVMEQQYWNQWNGHGGEGEGALALLNLSDGPAGKEPTTLSRSNKPMRVDLRDFTKPKKMVTSKLNTKKEKGKMKKQNRFEILGCLLEVSTKMIKRQRTCAFCSTLRQERRRWRLQGFL